MTNNHYGFSFYAGKHMLKTTTMFVLSTCFISCNNNSTTNTPPVPKQDVITATADTMPANTQPAGVSTTETSFNVTPSSFQYDSVPIELKKGLHFNVAVIKGYHINVAAEGLQRLRFLAVSPDKRLFATDMFDKSDNRKGRVLIFEEWNDSAKTFGKVSTYLDNLHNPNQVAFYKNRIYVAETDRLSFYAYKTGDEKPSGPATTIATFPAYGLSYKYGGWHLTRSLAFHNDKLYVSVGSSCNACLEKEEVRASVLEMDPDGNHAMEYARGLRNAVGIEWIGNELWVTGMGRDLIGPDKPEDLFQKIDRNGYYGWPFYFQYRNKIYADDQFKDSSRPVYVQAPPLAFAGFKAHSAPLGFEYMKDFDDAALRNSVLVCLHGSTSVWRERGNSVVRVEGGNKYSEVVTGFLKGKTENGRYGRPCDIMMKDERSFFFTDDHNGVLYYVWK